MGAANPAMYSVPYYIQTMGTSLGANPNTVQNIGRILYSTSHECIVGYTAMAWAAVNGYMANVVAFLLIGALDFVQSYASKADCV